MNRKPKLAALASAAMLLGTSATAFADHDHDRGRAGDLYDYAQVISSQPIINYVTVKTPVQECWEEMEYYTVDPYAGHTGVATIFGAIVGGVIGHQFGSGHGNDAATAAGSVIGATIGNTAARKRQAGAAVEQQARSVQRCKTSYRSHQEERINGYRVTYRYNGQKYMTEMPYDPGRQMRVRVDVRPAD
ncbi:MAG: glycine zipper 2TM domain-containing protein [Woeseiaceae bacterium]|nr:glycine zipper 2TM domain-containing protein [Woeseiaceae bacterium]